MPQSPALLPWRTVARQRPAAARRQPRRVGAPTAARPAELLGEVGLAEFAGAYPHELSGGMQQRVALVRAMALGAPLLLMDEPFAALDEITRADMRHLLARLCEQLATTVVFVTHSIAESVFLSDRVVVLSARPGRIVGIEPIDLPRPRHPELEDDPAFFAVETRLRALLARGRRRGDARRRASCLAGARSASPCSAGCGSCTCASSTCSAFILLPPSTIVAEIADNPRFYLDAAAGDRPPRRRRHRSSRSSCAVLFGPLLGVVAVPRAGRPAGAGG